MADGDDREESGDNKQQDGSNLPDVENLQIAEVENPEDIEHEYQALDSQLNQLDACLDSLEARNDDLMARLKAFLQQGAATQDASVTANGTEPGQGGEDTEGGEQQQQQQQSSDSKSTGTSASGS